jgi:hypothetical protein
MGECSWFAELGRATVREEKGGRLLRLALLGGTSVSDEGEEYEDPGGRTRGSIGIARRTTSGSSARPASQR